MPWDYSNWRLVTPSEPEPHVCVLIGTAASYPMVGKRCDYKKNSERYLSDEFYIPANRNRIVQLKSRPIYWLPIEGGMKCEE